MKKNEIINHTKNSKKIKKNFKKSIYQKMKIKKKILYIIQKNNR